MKIVSIIGTRPQIIKASALTRAIRTHFSRDIREIVLHTGQHYDRNMSDVFIRELGVPEPDYNLDVGSGTHGVQTARMLKGIEDVLLNERPDAMVVYGDTNSTLAGALAASKLHIPVVHIEAGLRSGDKRMPEEINRITSDHVSTLLFSPTLAGYENLIREGFDPENGGPYTVNNPRIYHCGDIMYDNALFFSELAEDYTSVYTSLDLRKDRFMLATVHRPSNTDNPDNLSSILRALMVLSEDTPVILPVHPRTKLKIDALPVGFRSELIDSPLHMIEPVTFLEMIALEKGAKMILTDSGGVQKEAYFYNKPCVILREETEWTELVENGNAILVGSNETAIIDAVDNLKKANLSFPGLFGNGSAAKFMGQEIINHLG